MTAHAPIIATGGARGMRIVATGLLVVMAGVFVAVRALAPDAGGWSYVRAFAEAAMVGGLADWFAVTALFRHPLGLPIPHTAIIPRNKDRIGDSLAAFLRDNFLTPSVVARRMRNVDFAGAAGRFLTRPAALSGGRMREGASRLAAHLLEALDRERLGGMVKSALAQRLRTLDLAPLVGQGLEAAIAERRHQPILDGITVWAGRTLAANEELIRAMIAARAGAVLRWTGLDATLATKILEGLHRLLDEMAADPDHPLRAKAEEGLADLARRLREDPAMQARVAAFRDEIVANPAVARWIDGLWEQGRSALLRAARDPERALAGRFGEALRQLGGALAGDARLARAVNGFARRATVGAVADYGDGIVRLVSDTIRGWDARTITSRLESAVGRDLQYIRVNGTIVGGLVGVALHAADMLL